MGSLDATICIRIGCSKPCFVESYGKKHPFCGKTCAKIFLSSDISKCSNKNCNRKKFIDSSIQKMYDYCGHTCARTAPNSNDKPCSLQSCTKPAYVDKNNPTKFYSFCSPNCYWSEISTLTQTKLTLLDPNDLDYDAAKGSFLGGIPGATIHGIIRIQMPKLIVDAHQVLRKQPGLNLYKLFHGTKTTCDPMNIIKSLKTICNNNINCGVCGIITKGNDTSRSNHGGGMWFAQSSSTSLGYCSAVNGNKVIFLVDVLSSGSPQPGYLVVNQNAATLPRYLVIFS